MPNRDKTGPMGMGPRTGRQMGGCSTDMIFGRGSRSKEDKRSRNKNQR